MTFSASSQICFSIRFLIEPLNILKSFVAEKLQNYEQKMIARIDKYLLFDFYSTKDAIWNLLVKPVYKLENSRD